MDATLILLLWSILLFICFAGFVLSVAIFMWGFKRVIK